MDEIKKIEVVCGTCSNNDDGLCDRFGIFVEDDDLPDCGSWESKN